MRVAAAQYRPHWLDCDATTGQVVAIIADAAAQGVEIVAFPETFLSGYPFWIGRTDGAKFDDPAQKRAYAAYLDAAVEIGGPQITRITEAVREYSVFTYLGITERGRTCGRGTVYCTLVAIDPLLGVVWRIANSSRPTTSGWSGGVAMATACGRIRSASSASGG